MQAAGRPPRYPDYGSASHQSSIPYHYSTSSESGVEHQMVVAMKKPDTKKKTEPKKTVELKKAEPKKAVGGKTAAKPVSKPKK